MKITFFNWLLGQQHRDDPIGDLARDTNSCAHFIEKKNKSALFSLISFRSQYDKKVIETFYLAWTEYKNFRKHIK